VVLSHCIFVSFVPVVGLRWLFFVGESWMNVPVMRQLVETGCGTTSPVSQRAALPSVAGLSLARRDPKTITSKFEQHGFRVERRRMMLPVSGLD